MTKRSAEREQFLADIITTAVEGGINYWAAVSSYHWSFEEPATTKVTVHEMDDDEMDYKEVGVRVDIGCIAGAISKIIDRNVELHLHESYRQSIAEASSANDTGELDSIFADIIVQVAVLGDVIYG